MGQHKMGVRSKAQLSQPGPPPKPQSSAATWARDKGLGMAAVLGGLAGNEASTPTRDKGLGMAAVLGGLAEDEEVGGTQPTTRASDLGSFSWENPDWNQGNSKNNEAWASSSWWSGARQ